MMDGRVFIWEVVSGASVDGSEGIWGQWWTEHMGTIVVMSIEFVVALWHFLRRIGMVENGGQAWVFFFLFFWRNGFGGYLFFLVMTCVCLLQRGYPFLLRWTILWWEGEVVFCAGFWSGLVWLATSFRLRFTTCTGIWITFAEPSFHGIWVWVSTGTVWLSSSFYTFLWWTGFSFLWEGSRWEGAYSGRM